MNRSGRSTPAASAWAISTIRSIMASVTARSANPRSMKNPFSSQLARCASVNPIERNLPTVDYAHEQRSLPYQLEPGVLSDPCGDHLT